MFQNSFIWKKKIWQKGHAILFYSNPIGSLYLVCTFQWHHNNLHWIISISEIYPDPLVIDLVGGVMAHTFVVIKNLFVIIVDGIPFISTHLVVLDLFLPTCISQSCSTFRLQEPCFHKDPQIFFIIDMLFLFTINQYKNLI